MATKYWYITGSTANWNSTNWYPSSSGVGTATTLLAADDAVLDANSGTGTLTLTGTGNTCNSFDATRFSGSLAGTANLSITNTALNRTSSAFPLFAFGAAMTQSYTGTTSFGGTGNGGFIYCNGKSFRGNVAFNSATSTFYLEDDFQTLPTNQLQFTNGTVYSFNNVYVGKVDTNPGTKDVNITSLYLTGNGDLSSTFTAAGLTSFIENLYVTDSGSLSKTLTLIDQFSPYSIYITGSGTGAYIIDTATTSTNSTIYVDQTGNSSISFTIGQIGGLYFLPGTNIDWDNAAGQTLSIAGDLILTGSMTASRTPNLTFNGGGNITLAGKSLYPGSTFNLNGGEVYLTEDFNNNIAVSVLNSSLLYPKGFRTTSALTIDNSTVDVRLLSPASGSGIISTAAVDSQRYSLVTLQGEIRYFIASNNPVPAASYQLREFYFSTGSTPTATVTNLVSKMFGKISGLTPTANGTTLIISASSNGTTYNGTTFSTGSITGEFPKTPLFTLGGGSATRRATGSGIIVNAAVDGQRYNVIDPFNRMYSFIASSTPLPTDPRSSTAYFFSTGSTAESTATNLTSRINLAGNTGYIASSSGTTLIVSASTNSGLYEDTVFLTGSLPGKIPDYPLFSLNSSRPTTFSVGSLDTTDSSLYLYATENTCSGNWVADGGSPTQLWGRDVYIGGNTTIPISQNYVQFYVDNLYINGTITTTGGGNGLYFLGTGTNILANTVTLTGDSFLILDNPNVLFSRLTVTNGQITINNAFNNTLRCSGVLTLTLGTITAFSNIYVGNLTMSGTGDKYFTTSNLYLTGTGSLYNPGTATNLLSTVDNIYITDNSADSKTLTLTNNPTSNFPKSEGSPLISLEGSGSGTYTITPSNTTTTPNIQVKNTGGADVSIGTGILSGLSFISGSNVNWNNIAGQTVVIIGNLLLTSSMTTSVTPGLSLANSTALELADLELKTGSLVLNTTSSIYITGSLKSNAAVSLINTSVTASNYVSCSALSLNNASLSCSNNMYIDSLATSGTGRKNIAAQELYVLGGSSLPTTVPTNLTSSFNTIYYLGDSSTARSITFTGSFGAPILEIDGDTLAGPITASLSTVYKPDVYVTNTGNSPISFTTSTLSSLSFISSSNVNWNNVAGQTLTISKSLELTSSMSTTSTPNLLLSGSGFNSLVLADQDLRTGTLTINTTNPINVSGSLVTNAAVTLTSSSVSVQNNFSSSGLVTINGGSRLTSSGSTFFAGSVSIASGSISSRGTTNTVSQSLTLVTGSISASGDLSVGTLVTTGAAPKTLSTPNLSFTGTGLLYTTGTNFTISSPLNSISVTGSATVARGLIFDNRLTSSLVYLGGNGSGLITASFGAAARPNVYVTNIGTAPISFLTATLQSLSFISSSNVNWNNVAGQTLTISRSLELTSSMSTTTTPNLILSGSGFNFLALADEQLRTGTLTINTPNSLNVSGSILSNAAVTIISSSVTMSNSFSSSNLTLNNSSISASNTISIGPLFVSGTLSKKLISDTLIYTGTESLPFTSSANLTSSMNTLFFDGSTNIARTITYDTQFKPTTIYIGGALSGSITASFGTSSIPTVYVDNTGRAPITFSSASISSLTFPSGSRANWNTSGSQTLTISGSLTLTGSMTASRTPNLVFNGNSNITLAGKNLSGSLISQAPFTQSFLDNFSSSGSVLVNGFLSASNITITRVDSLNVLGNCNISSSTLGTTTITGTGSVWNIPSTSTVNIPNNTIRIVNTTNNAVTFSGGTNEIYGELAFARGASTADNLISGSNTFINLRDTGTAAHTMSLATGSTQTVGSFDVRGASATTRVTVKSTTGLATLYKDPLGLVVSDYISVNGVTAISGSGPWTWFAGPNSTLVNAAGWFTTGSGAITMVKRLGSQGVG